MRGVGFEEEVVGFGRALRDARMLLELDDSPSCRAREAAVGAVRCEDTFAGRVVCGLVAVDDPVFVLSAAAPARAIEAAVGAVRELLLFFGIVVFFTTGEEGASDLGVRGDLIELELVVALVVMAFGFFSKFFRADSTAP